MAAIKDLTARGKGNVKAGNWSRQVYKRDDDRGLVVHIFHYGTRMLTYTEEPDGSADVISWSLGWGSVTDQGGMNKIFKALHVPFYYRRKGGAAIV
jgi:hypothetical protein